MPFEAGLAVATAMNSGGKHQWVIFESKAHRLSKSLSDLDGTDPHVHEGRPEGVLRELTNALVRSQRSPSFANLLEVYREVRGEASKLKQELGGASLFEARAFKDVVVIANEICSRHR